MLEIEIVEINIIEGGVEVFARAWENGTQIGFGVDGTIDIERFRIFNPPILVADIKGDIKVVSTSYNPVTEREETTISTYREDPEEATLQVIVGTIGVMKNKYDSTRIILNKRGNTTSTFYSGSGDALMAANLGGTNFLTQRNAATARSGVFGGDSQQWGFLARDTFYLYRAFFPFDTSAIPDADVVSAATFSVKVASNYNNGCSVTAYLAPFAPANPASLVSGDWDSITYTDHGNRVWSAASAGNYFDVTMNSTGYGDINKTGFTNLAFISNYDFDEIVPCNTTSNNGAQLYYSERSGTTDDPKLVVEHAAAGGGEAQAARRGAVMMM